MTLAATALHVARSGLVHFGNEALPHVNHPHVHLIACVHALGREPEVRFIQLPHPGPVPGYEICSVGILLHLFVVWVDDGRDEFNQGVLHAAPDPVVLTDFDKVLAGQARNPKRFYIVGGFYHSELVVGAADKPGEAVAKLCVHALVVDEDMMAHAQLGDDNLLIYVGTTAGVLEVDDDHLVLVSSKILLSGVDVVVHHDRVDGVHHREIRLPRVGLHFMLAEHHWSAARHPLSTCHRGCACCVVGRDRKVEKTKVIIMAAGIKGEVGRPGILAHPNGSSNLQC